MLSGWAVILTALVYLCALFAVAHWGDLGGRRIMRGQSRATIYALTLAVYCTSWTFYGSVGLATRSGLDFLAVYLGPVLVVGLGHLVVRRVVRLAKAQNTTSIADFVAARYGKSESVAAIVCLVAVVGCLPYIALQLKAISFSLETFLAAIEPGRGRLALPFLGDLALFVALILAGFSIAFGTRHIDATEHQDGLMLAIAMESLVKLVAFLCVGATVVYFVFDGFGDLLAKAAARGIDPGKIVADTSGPATFLAITLIAGFASLLLPRQFHVTVVENRDERDIPRAAVLFTAYLVLINLFVLPLAIAGLAAIPAGDRDMTVLALPLAHGHGLVALFAFIGGLSAATAMVIVETVALSIMVSNDLVMPLLLRRGLAGHGPAEATASDRRPPSDLGSLVLITRRIAILVALLLGYLYYLAAGDAALAAIGLVSFAAIAQIAPAFFGGLLWRRATALGATAGLLSGITVWAYTLLLPSLGNPPLGLAAVLEHGPFGIEALRPTALLGLDLPQLTHGVFWSLSANLVAYVVFSLARQPTTRERLQANDFIGPESVPVAQALRLWRSTITLGELKAAIARYLGEERTREAFAGIGRGREADDGTEADIQTLQFAEHLLASAIGAASSRLVLSLLLRRRNVSTKAALKLLDDASAVLQYSRDILQNALDHARQGITVFDRDQRLMCWNREFAAVFDLPRELLRVGIELGEIVRSNAERGLYGPGEIAEHVGRRLASFLHDIEPVRLRLVPLGRVIEFRSNHLPDGGILTTYTDITEAVAAEEALERANETLERRVRERTEELVRVNAELSRAKGAADEANLSKTRFLAAASHDILQPLNAARLYAATLVERDRGAGDASLASNVDASLEAVEEILGALLEISKLDGGAMQPEWSNVRVDEVFRQLSREFEPLARETGVRLTFVASALAVRTDRRLFRRLLRNLVSNAIKYTPKGRVLVGARRRGEKLRIEVHDIGLGIPRDKHALIFREFTRLDAGARTARGLGLGLSIVERIARLLDHKVSVRSTPARGSVFSVEASAASAPPAASSDDPAGATSGPATPLGGLVVLAIDNEPAILDGMRTLLGSWGCRVLTAASEAEALGLASGPEGPPAVIIADYHLDSGDGIAVVAAVRRALDPALPAILLTADRSPEVRDRARSADIHVLNKPLKPAALRSLLSQWRVSRMAAE